MEGEATRFTRRSQGCPAPAEEVEAALGSSLRAELEGARWFHGKGRPLSALRLVDHVEIPGSSGGRLAVVGVEYTDGDAEEYAMPIRADATGAMRTAAPDDPIWVALAALALGGGLVDGERGTVAANPGGRGELRRGAATVRPLEADQSNTSLLVDERIVVKCYRRLRPGPHPEQELLEGLTRVGSTHAPRLLGALTYVREGLTSALVTAYDYVDGAQVGWEPMIVDLVAALEGPATELEGLVTRGAELGRCAGELHRELVDAFGTSRATEADARAERESATAALDDAIIAVAALAPELGALGPAAHRALDGLDRLAGTQLQRIHGDLHVGQLLRGPAGIVAIDFEGDPTLPTDERRRAASPLRDVASLLLSLDHVAAAASRRRGFAVATEAAFAWSARAREATLSAYVTAAPPGPAPDASLLRAFEIEKEWREAVYAARVLPEWFYAPRLVLQRLLT